MSLFDIQMDKDEWARREAENGLIVGINPDTRETYHSDGNGNINGVPVDEFFDSVVRGETPFMRRRGFYDPRSHVATGKPYWYTNRFGEKRWAGANVNVSFDTEAQAARDIKATEERFHRLARLSIKQGHHPVLI